MNIGKTLFAQIMEFIPWTSFARIVDRHGAELLGAAQAAHSGIAAIAIHDARKNWSTE